MVPGPFWLSTIMYTVDGIIRERLSDHGVEYSVRGSSQKVCVERSASGIVVAMVGIPCI